MDDATLELLSRYVDGDLAEEERVALERRLVDEEALRHRLDALERGRAGVAALADREHPPRSLDALIEPLRRAPVRPVVVRPVFRWLAAAASVAAAGLLAVQLARQHPAPTPPGELAAPHAPAPQPSPGHYYRLQPLPRSPDADQAPIGVSERLLRDGPATPVPEPLPPLDVMGPLDAPGPVTAEGAGAPGEASDKGVAAPVPEPARAERTTASRDADAEPKFEQISPQAAKASGRTLSPHAAGPQTVSGGMLVVRTASGAARLPIAGLAPDTPPLELVVEVRGGQIVAVRATGPDASVPDQVVAALIGIAAPGLVDATYRARIAGRAAE